MERYDIKGKYFFDPKRNKYGKLETSAGADRSYGNHISGEVAISEKI